MSAMPRATVVAACLQDGASVCALGPGFRNGKAKGGKEMKNGGLSTVAVARCMLLAAAVAAGGAEASREPQAGDVTTSTLPGGATMEMVWCPAGTFLMGSGHKEHQVTLTKGFWMGKYEVTQAQWKSVMGNNPSGHRGDALPVEYVTWDDCQQFCRKAGLSLPTEAQWEYACRAGSRGPYAGTGNLDDMGWYLDNSGVQTHPVGTKHPNSWGIYDMHGNVAEWCADWYDCYPDGPVTDPQGSLSGLASSVDMLFGGGGSPSEWNRVLRGGSWDSVSGQCTSAFRVDDSPSHAFDFLGFRVVRNLSEE